MPEYDEDDSLEGLPVAVDGGIEKREGDEAADGAAAE